MACWSILSQEESINRIGFLLGESVTSSQLSLLDPATGKRMSQPGRGLLCDHIDAVDLDLCLSDLQEDGSFDPPWLCPVCGIEYSQAEELEVDGWLLEVLKQAPEYISDVIVYPDGEWEAGKGVLARKSRDLPEKMPNDVVELVLSEDEEPRQKRPKAEEVIELD